MYIVGLDLGKNKSQICVQDKDGKIIAELRCNTDRASLAAAFARFPGARVLMEASTSSQWVARHLETLGCTVIVGDPRFSPMYAHANKKIKTDKRDARALADALRMGAYKACHLKSERARQYHGALLTRGVLVESRTMLINQVRSLCEREGVKIGRCRGEGFADELAEHQVPKWLAEVIAPAISHIAALDAQIAECDKGLKALAREDRIARNLQTVHGIGPMNALAFIAVIDDPKRFDHASEVVSYLGLAPGQRNSGDSKRRPGAITKAGDPLVRGYLFEAALCHTGKLAPNTPLKEWGVALKTKKDFKKKALVGVARRLARILWAMWRDDAPFDASKTAASAAATNVAETEAPVAA